MSRPDIRAKCFTYPHCLLGWVFAQLLGLGLSVVLLKRTDVAGSYTSLFGSWVAAVVAHVIFRYIALSKVVFRELNLKRAKVCHLIEHQIK
eukprot:1182169-Prorocentrum_minimum.AAC.1